ncbi:hypothetical protein ABMA32_20315 [Mesorhizobium sp. VNQ89]|uniref:hypothetical protein n=1 Tax=Mesorhizobium quangtriensis TaxID=3157709 RepID=UPI0032B7096A
MKASFFAVLAMVVLPTDLAAQERTSIGHSYEDGAALVYGVPDSRDMTLSFDCATNSDTLAFVYAFEPQNASDGMKVEVLLRSGDVAVPVATVGSRLEMDDIFVLEGELKFDSRTAGIITSAGFLQISVGEQSEGIPLAGSRAAATSLLDACIQS